MDTNDLLAHARARFDHETQRRVLKEKYLAKMVFAYSGGLWRAGQELLVTLMTCPEPRAVILDLYENPVEIDTKELRVLCQQRWQEQMTAWNQEWQQLRSQR